MMLVYFFAFDFGGEHTIPFDSVHEHRRLGPFEVTACCELRIVKCTVLSSLFR